MVDRFGRARGFLYSYARLLERLLFAVRFEEADASAVVRLISAYQNPDGGLGHTLEPDLRCPESQPLFAEIGLSALHSAGVRDHGLALSVCGFLEGVSDASGLVPILLPSPLEWPHAAHWGSTGEPGINPTASSRPISPSTTAWSAGLPARSTGDRGREGVIADWCLEDGLELIEDGSDRAGTDQHV